MFEQLVRPFASRQVTTTRRVVPVKSEDKPEVAKIAWGAVGSLPQGKVQPQGTNLENIESVGFNLRGNIDNFNQSSRRAEYVDVPIKDSAGNEIGKVTLDRAKSITYGNKNVDPQGQFGADPQKQFGYLPNTYKPQNQIGRDPHVVDNIVSRVPPTAATPAGAGIRSSVPSADVSQRTDYYVYPE